MSAEQAEGLAECFRAWLADNPDCNGWGLAWYFAAEFVERFHTSHGYRVDVIEHEGLGYYGLAVVGPGCLGAAPAWVGRFTMHGDVENWETGGAGDHGLETIAMVSRGRTAESLVSAVIAHLGLMAYPSQAHRACRHRHRGPSFVLIFGILARLALRNEPRIAVRSVVRTPEGGGFSGERIDDYHDRSGYYSVGRDGREVLVLRGDGVLLTPGREESLWERYMAGETIGTLVRSIEKRLGL